MKIIKNFFSLSSMNLITLVISLITVPYLINVLGVEQYGQYAFYFIIAQFFLVLIDYGYDIFLVKKLASVKNSFKINCFYSTTVKARLLMYVSTIIISFLIIFIFSFEFTDSFVFIILTISNISMVFSITWILQIKENLFPYAIIQLFGRLLYLLLILLIKDLTIELVSLCYLVSSLFITAVTIYYGRYSCELRLFLSSKTISSKKVFIDASSIFSYRFFNSASSPINGILISYYLGPVGITYYDVYNKFSGVLNMLSYSAAQATFPVMSRNENVFRDRVKVTLIVLTILLTYLFGVVVYYYAENIIVNLLTYILDENVVIFEELAFYIIAFACVVAINTFFSRVLVILNMQKIIFLCTIMALLLALLLSSILFNYFPDSSVAMPTLIFQASLFVFLYVNYIIKRKLNY